MDMRTMRREQRHVHRHPRKHLMKHQKAAFIPFTSNHLHSADTHNSLDGEGIDLLACVSSEEFSVLSTDLLQPGKRGGKKQRSFTVV